MHVEGIPASGSGGGVKRLDLWGLPGFESLDVFHLTMYNNGQETLLRLDFFNFKMKILIWAVSAS